MLWSCANGILLVDSVIMFREVMQVELIGLCVISCVYVLLIVFKWQVDLCTFLYQELLG